MTNTARVTSALLFVVAIAALTGCSKFAVKTAGVLNVGSVSTPNPAELTAIFGKAKYDATCVACHGPAETSTKRGASFERIKGALSTNPIMQGLASSLSDSDVRAISGYLVSGAVTPICESAPDVGRTAIHRLNSVEYDNTLRDLLGIEGRISVLAKFAPDTLTGNFSNNALGLGLTISETEKLVDAAGLAMDAAFANAGAKAKLLTCVPTGATCVQSILSKFLERAFRRPADAAEISTYVQLVGKATGLGESAEDGVKFAMTAALSSPHFLFRSPRHPDPLNPRLVANLSSYDLATRLSYFLWSSMPDDTLFSSAKSGALLQDAELVNQVKRMLKDPKAAALADNFASEWLRLAKLNRAMPNTSLFPHFSEQLRADMKVETSMFLKDLFARDASFFEIVNAKHSFLNERLANLYGIGGITGTEFRRVDLSNTERMGVLTQASVLTMNSHTSTTSIVRRGIYVLSNFLCSEPLPPPAGVDTTLPAPVAGTTTRERQIAHSTTPRCASCHMAIDPIGFTLEHFDPIGKYRTQEGNAPIDSSAVIAGRSVNDARGLVTTVTDDVRFRGCATQMLFTYALGRLVKPADACTINRLAATAVGPDKAFSAAVIALVKSDPFRKQRGEGELQ